MNESDAREIELQQDKKQRPVPLIKNFASTNVLP